MANLRLCSIFILGLMAATNASAENPWLLGEGQSVVSVSYVSESYDEALIADKRTDIPKISQQTTWLYYGTALNDSLMVDVQIGYVESSWDAEPPLGDISGFADSKIRLRWNARNEFYEDSGPSLSFAIAGIIRGSYERSQLTDKNNDGIKEPNVHAPGDKSNGIEVTAQIGQSLTDIISLSAELGYRWRLNDVPNDGIANVGFYVSFTEQLSVRFIYSVVHSLSGPDIGDQGVNPDVFHKTKEEVNSREIVVGYDFMDGHGISIGAADVISGRNTGDSLVYHAGYSYSF